MDAVSTADEVTTADAVSWVDGASLADAVTAGGADTANFRHSIGLGRPVRFTGWPFTLKLVFTMIYGLDHAVHYSR